MPAAPGRTIRTMLAGLLGLALATGVLVGTSTPAAAQPHHRYIVQTSSNASVVRPMAEARQAGGTVLTRFEHVLSGFTADLTPAQALRLAADTSVVSVVRDSAVQADAAPPWGLDRIDQRTTTGDGSYQYATTGAGTTVFVIDSGVRLSHSQFGRRAVSGYDFVGRDRNAGDCYGHGTHVAGIIGGSTYGVATSAKIVSVRVLDCEGSGSTSDLIAALDWVVAHKPSGPAVVNLSLGAPSTTSGAKAVESAAAKTVAAGIPVVAAAGNLSSSACRYSPARVPSVITVAASNPSDARAAFSNDGSCVDLFAPGVDVRSASNASNGATEVMSGTSMAAPHVTGVLARMLQDDPLAKPAPLAAELLRRSTTGTITDAGGSPNRLLYAAPPSTLATRPTSTMITRSDARHSVTLRWAPPTGTGGTTITGYRVIRSGSADARKKRYAVVNLSAGARSCTFGSLAAGGRYTVRVLAVTADGPGAAAAATTTLLATPGSPKIKKASSGSKHSKGISVTARWAKPSSGGPVAGYQVKADRVGSRRDKIITVPATSRTVTITGLAKNKRYKITVRGLNVAGAGSWSKKSGKVTAR